MKEKFYNKFRHFIPDPLSRIEIADWWLTEVEESYKAGILEGMRMGRVAQIERDKGHIK